MFKTVAGNCAKYFRLTKAATVFRRTIHGSPLARAVHYPDIENNYVYNVLQKLPSPAKLEMTNSVNDLKDFEKLLGQNWRLSSASEIVKAFKSVVNFCQTNKISLADQRFDNLVDGVMDNCEYLNDEEILDLLYILVKLPPCDSIGDRNFDDMWSCLDDICCWKMNQWSLEKQFAFADAWFHLKMGRHSDFFFEVVNRMASKPGRLNKNEVLRFYFYRNVARKQPVGFDFEDTLAKVVDFLSVDELAVVALGHFKSQTKIKLLPILAAMVAQVTENSKTINEISLTAILKIIRYSQRSDLYNEYNKMLDKLVDEIPRLSIECCLHIALLGQSLAFCHEKTLNLCCEKIIRNIENVRFKEIERVLLAASHFNIDPDTSRPFYQTCFDEIHKESRWSDIVKYNRCIAPALNYLAVKQFYSQKLTNYVLDNDFIVDVYGKAASDLPSSLLLLDSAIDIEFENYKGNRLALQRKYKRAKYFIEYPPSYSQWKKPSASEKLHLDVVDHVMEIAGKDNVRLDHVLPHFCKSDIILCKDKNKGFIEPFGFQQYILGDIKRPFYDDNLIWYALVVLAPNLTSRNGRPLGTQIMKARHLRKIGYHTNFILWNEYSNLDKCEKIEYLLKKITRAEEND